MKKYFKTSVLLAMVLLGASVPMYTHATELTTVEEEKYTIYVELGESYNSSYDLYEESIDNMFFFYSNVANGDFSTKPVVFDFPANIDYTVEKDGTEINYATGMEITGVGNYVVRLEAEYGEIVYNSTFRFTIREDVTATAADTTDISDFSLDSLDDIELTEEDLVLDENEEIDQEVLDQIIEQQGELMSSEMNTTAVDVSGPEFIMTKLQQSYNAEISRYEITLMSGEKINCNVPNGAIVNDYVSIELPGEMTANVYKDGVLLEDFGELLFTEDGFYKVEFVNSSLNYAVSYPEGTAAPFITFRIVFSPVNDMQVFTAPRNCKIVAAGINSVAVTDEFGSNQLYLDNMWMEEDGTYSFGVYDMNVGNTYYTTITKDTEPPQFSVNINNGVAVPSYISTDIQNVELFLNGQKVENYNGQSIEGKGNYRLVVYDAAGNSSYLDFSVANRFKGNNFLAIVLSIMVILAGVVYFRLVRTSFKVR